MPDASLKRKPTGRCANSCALISCGASRPIGRNCRFARQDGDESVLLLEAPRRRALYQKAVEELAEALDRSKGMGRKGVVLSFLMRFKQICNHPSQWLGDGAWAETESGKFARLRELAEVIAAKQEKMLVFTQFREATQPIAAFLGHVFGREGLILHGGTPVSKRKELVRRFQDDELTPFFVLSLKAGGAGLNLTAASHVVHFDRWWNPASRIKQPIGRSGLGSPAMFSCISSSVAALSEDKIDQLIESKADARQGRTRRRCGAAADRAQRQGVAGSGGA